VYLFWRGHVFYSLSQWFPTCGLRISGEGRPRFIPEAPKIPITLQQFFFVLPALGFLSCFLLLIAMNRTRIHLQRLWDCRGQLKCDGTRVETRFRLPAKWTSPFKSAVASVQSTTGSRGVRISGSNAGYTMFRGSVKGTGYPLHLPVSPSLLLPCVTECRHI